MFAQKLDSCDSTFTKESQKAIDALTICTAAKIGKARGRVVLDAPEQQKIEDFWARNIEVLMEKSQDVLQ